MTSVSRIKSLSGDAKLSGEAIDMEYVYLASLPTFDYPPSSAMFLNIQTISYITATGKHKPCILIHELNAGMYYVRVLHSN